MLKTKIKEALLMRGILEPRNWLMKKAGFSRNKATRYLAAKIKVWVPKDFHKICLALNCSVDDLLYYDPDPRQKALSPDHRLLTLIPPWELPNWDKSLSKLSAKERGEVLLKLNALIKNHGPPEN